MILFVGFLFMLFIFAIVGILTRSLAMLIDLPSILLIVVSLLFFMLASKSGSVIRKYINASFKKNHAYTKTELAGLSIAIKNTIKFTLATGGFGFMSGLVASLGYLGASERFGPNLAISLLTLTYSIMISYFVFFPTQVWADNKINMMKDDA